MIDDTCYIRIKEVDFYKLSKDIQELLRPFSKRIEHDYIYVFEVPEYKLKEILKATQGSLPLP